MRGPGTIEYLKDPEAITERSFSVIRGEADLTALPDSLKPVAVRVMHACGMTDIVTDLRYDPRVVDAAAEALRDGRPVITDCEAVRAAIAERLLPAGTGVLCTLNDPRTEGLAARSGTTRSAAAVAYWRPHLEGAVVVIGNAPTTLFALLEALDDGAPRPSAILAFPVGFVGASESKDALAADSRGVPFLTLLGRRGGSAMAAAALNAVAAAATS